MADEFNLIELTSDIVSSHVTNNNVAVNDLPNLIQQVHQALSGLGQSPQSSEQSKKEPAVSVRASIKPDYLVCLECGRKQKTLKRHLLNAHGVTPEQYRAEFELNRDYPMVAPAYSKRRSEMAQAIGLGRRKSEAGEGAAASETTPAKKKRAPRKSAAAE